MGFFKAVGLFSGWVGKYRKINSFRIIRQRRKINQSTLKFSSLCLKRYIKF